MPNIASVTTAIHNYVPVNSTSEPQTLSAMLGKVGELKDLYGNNIVSIETLDNKITELTSNGSITTEQARQIRENLTAILNLTDDSKRNVASVRDVLLRNLANPDTAAAALRVLISAGISAEDNTEQAGVKNQKLRKLLSDIITPEQWQRAETLGGGLADDERYSAENGAVYKIINAAVYYFDAEENKALISQKVRYLAGHYFVYDKNADAYEYALDQNNQFVRPALPDETDFNRADIVKSSHKFYDGTIADVKIDDNGWLWYKNTDGQIKQAYADHGFYTDNGELYLDRTKLPKLQTGDESISEEIAAQQGNLNITYSPLITTSLADTAATPATEISLAEWNAAGESFTLEYTVSDDVVRVIEERIKEAKPTPYKDGVPYEYTHNVEYKLIKDEDGYKVKYFDYAQGKAVESKKVRYIDGHFFLYRIDAYINDKGEKEDFTYAYELQNENGCPVFPAVPSAADFDSAPVAFRYRFLEINSDIIDEADLKNIKIINGLLWYKDADGVIQQARSWRGFYCNDKGEIKLNGKKQVVLNGELVPEDFVKKLQEEGSQIFRYTNLFLNMGRGEDGKYFIDRSKAVYVIDKNRNFYFYQNGKLEGPNRDTVDIERGEEVENIWDAYSAYLIKNPDSRNADLEDKIMACRLRLRYARPNNDEIIIPANALGEGSPPAEIKTENKEDIAWLFNEVDDLLEQIKNAHADFLKENLVSTILNELNEIRGISSSDTELSDMIKRFFELTRLDRSGKNIEEITQEDIQKITLSPEDAQELAAVLATLEAFSKKPPEGTTPGEMQIVQSMATIGANILGNDGFWSKEQGEAYLARINQNIINFIKTNHLENEWNSLAGVSDSLKIPIIEIQSTSLERDPVSTAPSVVYSPAEIMSLLEAAITNDNLQEALQLARQAIGQLEELIRQNGLDSSAEIIEDLKVMLESLGIAQEILDTALVSDEPQDIMTIEPPFFENVLAQAKEALVKNLQGFSQSLETVFKQFKEFLPAVEQQSPMPIKNWAKLPPGKIETLRVFIAEVQSKMKANIHFNEKIIETSALNVVLQALVLAPDFLAGQPLAVRRDIAVILPLIRREAEKIVSARLSRYRREQITEAQKQQEVKSEMANMLTPFARMVFLGEICLSLSEKDKPDFALEAEVPAPKLKIAMFAARQGLNDFRKNPEDNSYDQEVWKEAINNALWGLVLDERSLEFLMRNFSKLPADLQLVLKNKLIAILPPEALLDKFRFLLSANQIQAMQEAIEEKNGVKTRAEDIGNTY